MSLVFIDTERVWRGGQDQLLTLLSGLIRRGHTVHLVCYPGTRLEHRARAAGATVHPAAIRTEWSPLTFARLLVLLRRIRPDVLAFNTPRPILMGTLASCFASVRARIIFRRVNFPLRKNLFTRLKYTFRIDTIIAISESIRHQLEKCGIAPSRIRCVYEGLELEPVQPGRDFGFHERPVVIGTVGHMSPEKGHRYLVEAAALIPGARDRLQFVLVGDGECRPELEELARRHGLQDCVRFVGFQERPSELLRGFDIFVLPSLSEGLSSAILAAMAESLPVVATGVGGIPELVRPGETGVLVPPADAGALARALERLVADGEEARRLGRNGRRRVEEHFTLERKVRETEEICAALVAARLAPAGPGSR